jgi:biopolymer transport protein ExbD
MPEVMDEEVVHHEPKKRPLRDPARMTLNLTSMIDVIFQLLIYFVITASFSVGEGVITANLPEIGIGKAAEVEEPPKPKIRVRVSTRGLASYRLEVAGFGDQPASFKDLAAFLLRHQKNPDKGLMGSYPPDTPVLIEPDSTVRWQHVVNAFNAAVKAKYTNISFAPAEDG